ncbi:uncharacterized protein LOC114242210 [Bombyx mandarina]|uniref:Uncharacterized protein LOC114242210 n=1 Tax=Bombyx mandarina TaxID=7092 RepID=A0A6J2JHQ3_BOMMA|nr:uncharacterized protein LOC114242210 [Bombyx mandarina]
MYLFSKNVPSVIFVSLFLLANAQRTSNNNRDLEFQELARQNKITKQILEAFLQKKLGVKSNAVRPPSVLDILPVKMHTKESTLEQSNKEEDFQEDLQETQDYVEDDNLQSVESEQIDSFLDSIEGMYSIY